MTKHLKNTAINIALLLGVLLVCWVAVEIYLRITGFGAVGERIGNVVHHVADEYDHYVVLNSLELRESEITPKEENEFRILIIGDSFTYGLGVEEEQTFVRRTENLLRKAAARDKIPVRFRVINGGVGGGPYQQREWFSQTGISLEPDLVVEAFYIGNDVYDDIVSRENRASYRGVEGVPQRGIIRHLLQNIKIFDWLWSRLVNIPACDKLMFKLGLRYSNRGLFRKEISPRDQEAFNLTLEAILDIKERLDREEIDFMVLIIPSIAQVLYGEDRPEEEDYRRPNKILTGFLKEHNIEYIDLLPRMESAEDTGSLYYIRDSHWTGKGHALAAEALANKIYRKYSRYLTLFLSQE